MSSSTRYATTSTGHPPDRLPIPLPSSLSRVGIDGEPSESVRLRAVFGSCSRTRHAGTSLRSRTNPGAGSVAITSCTRYVRNPIYVGFLGVLLGQRVLLGSLALLTYTAAGFCVGGCGPILARRFGDDSGRAIRPCAPGSLVCAPRNPSRSPERQGRDAGPDRTDARSHPFCPRRCHRPRCCLVSRRQMRREEQR